MARPRSHASPLDPTTSRLARRAAAVGALLLAAAGGSVAQPAPSLDGRWLTASGNLAVDIAPCGERRWCGTVTRVLSDRSMSRPGESMSPGDGRPALGLRLLHDLVPEATAASDGAGAAPPTRWTGRIFNRENGKTYDAVLSMDAPTELRVRPYVGLPLFGRTQTWQRLPDAPAAPSALPAARAASAGGDR